MSTLYAMEQNTQQMQLKTYDQFLAHLPSDVWQEILCYVPLHPWTLQMLYGKNGTPKIKLSPQLAQSIADRTSQKIRNKVIEFKDLRTKIPEEIVLMPQKLPWKGNITETMVETQHVALTQLLNRSIEFINLLIPTFKSLPSESKLVLSEYLWQNHARDQTTFSIKVPSALNQMEIFSYSDSQVANLALEKKLATQTIARLLLIEVLHSNSDLNVYQAVFNLKDHREIIQKILPELKIN